MMNEPLRLGVNVDHVATVRQARGTPYPDPVEAGLLAAAAGADGITIHLREDRRHIQEHDVQRLLAGCRVPVNLEIGATPEMVDIARRMKPEWVCLVPERREELTTEGGLDLIAGGERIAAACRVLGAEGIRVSLFVDPDPRQLDAALGCGCAALEIHTGRYADAPAGAEQDEELYRIRQFARLAREAGFEVHAGHGLHLQNVAAVAAIGDIVELNIGHSIVARALFIGLPAACAEMRRAMDQARG